MMQRSDRNSEEAMIALLSQNDQQSFGVLYEYYAPVLFGIVRSIIENQESAETVLQLCFRKIWNSRKVFDASGESLFMWMYKIAREISLKSRISIPETGGYPTSGEEEKLALELVMIYGLSYQEASVWLNIPLEMLKFKIRSALQQTPQTSVRQ